MLGALTLMGCIDDNYDLSDIDSEVQVDVKDLVLPINIDDIVLSNIFELKGGQSIKIAQNPDGSQFYAMVQSGNFDAESVNIPRVYVKAPAIPSTVTTISLESEQARLRAARSGVSFPIQTVSTTFSYSAGNVDPAIVSLSGFTGDMVMDWSLAIDGLGSTVSGFTLNDIVLQLPKGLTLVEDEGGKYDPSTGLLSLPPRHVNGTSFDFHMKATAVDFKLAGGILSNHTLNYSGAIYIKSGKMDIDTSSDLKPGASAADVPDAFNLKCSYKFSDITVRSFSGEIEYQFKGFHLPNIGMGNVPTILQNSGTDIKIHNPCVLLHYDNPFQRYNIRSITGFELTANRPTGSTSYHIDYNEKLQGDLCEFTQADHGAIYNLCLSPYSINELPKILPNTPGEATIDVAAYMTPAPEHVLFTKLSDVLSGETTGNGIPKSITPKVVNPRMPRQEVTDFPLGSNDLQIKGSYLLYAPLRFDAGSVIIYTGETTGWYSETLSRLTVTKLTLDADVTSDMPLSGDFIVTPLDKDGNDITGLTITPAKLAANGTSHVTMVIEGNITNLDGIRYDVVAKSNDDSAPLNPAMNIKLANIRPSVTGYYRDNL